MIIQLNIPNDVQKKLEKRAANRGETIEKYLEMLIEEDVQFYFEGPEHLRVKSEEHLEQLIQEGMESPAIEMTDDDWVSLHRRIRERFGQ